jgi:hypothetical protein
MTAASMGCKTRFFTSPVGQSCRSALNLGGAAPPYQRHEEFCPAPASMLLVVLVFAIERFKNQCSRFLMENVFSETPNTAGEDTLAPQDNDASAATEFMEFLQASVCGSIGGTGTK